MLPSPKTCTLGWLLVAFGAIVFILLIQIAALDVYVWKMLSQNDLYGAMRNSPVLDREAVITYHAFGFFTKSQRNRKYLWSYHQIAMKMIHMISTPPQTPLQPIVERRRACCFTFDRSSDPVEHSSIVDTRIIFCTSYQQAVSVIESAERP